MKLHLMMITLGVAFVAAGCRTTEPRVEDIATLIESVQFELPVELELTYMLPPEGTSPFVAKLIFKNSVPVRPSDPDFPSDDAPPNAVLFGTVTGEGMGTQLGRFTYSERYYGIPGFRIVAQVTFVAENGDELYATALAQAGPTIPPPFPNATFSGQFTFTGGTGRFVGARGRASIAAQQLGEEPLPGMPPNIPGRTAVALCGWIDLARSDSRPQDR
jgi:hypothetical protein